MAIFTEFAFPAGDDLVGYNTVADRNVSFEVGADGDDFAVEFMARDEGGADPGRLDFVAPDMAAPWWALASPAQMPQASTLIRTSPSPSSGTGYAVSSLYSVWLYATRAFMVFGIDMVVSSCKY
jgi:hypothetical protein